VSSYSPEDAISF